MAIALPARIETPQGALPSGLCPDTPPGRTTALPGPIPGHSSTPHPCGVDAASAAQGCAAERPEGSGESLTPRRGGGAEPHAICVRPPAALGPAERWVRRGRQAAEWTALVERIARERRCTLVQAWAAAQPRLSEFPDLPKSVSYQTWRRWRRGLRDPEGRVDIARCQAITPAYHRGGRPTVAEPGHPFIQLVFRHYLREQGPSLPECVRLAELEARQRGMAHPEMLLSAAQVARCIKTRVDPQAVLLARLGPERYRNEVADWVDRDWSQVPPGHCLVGDHHLFDAAIRVPDPGRDDGWRARRPWLSLWMDNRSLAFLGWVIRDIAPDCGACEDSLLIAIRAMGNSPPAVLYVDNGGDFQKVGFTTPIVIDGVEYSIARSLGCSVVSAIAYNPRAKVIEREFRPVAESFARYWFGYLGNRPGNRPWRGDFAWENPAILPSLDEFCQAFAWWVQNLYHAQYGRGSKITGGRTPAEAWSEYRPLRAPLSDHDLAMAFLRPVARSARDPLCMVGRGGRIRLANTWYQSPGLWPWQDKRVLVKLSRQPGDQAIYCYTPDGRPICRAPLKEAAPALAGTGEARAQVGAAIRAAASQLKHARTALRALTAPGAGLPPVGPVLDRLAIAGQGEAQARALAEGAARALAAGGDAAPAPPVSPVAGADADGLRGIFDDIVLGAGAGQEAPAAGDATGLAALMEELDND